MYPEYNHDFIFQVRLINTTPINSKTSDKYPYILLRTEYYRNISIPRDMY